MRSAATVDRHAPVKDGPQVRDLLVLWQHPDSREIVPIGRFVHDGHTYSFSYTRAAAEISDFRPLPGLDDLYRRYVSSRLPAVFGQRVMEPDRPDYVEYLRTLGLDPERATPWEQIVRSGGARAGDTLQFMQIPTVTDGRARARFLVSGVRHIPGTERIVSGRAVTVSPERQESALRRLRPGAAVDVEPEENNPIDADACLLTVSGIPVGWVPRTLSAGVRELTADGPVEAKVVRVGDPGTPPHLRLVLDLSVAAPTGFAFDRERLWEPLLAQ